MFSFRSKTLNDIVYHCAHDIVTLIIIGRRRTAAPKTRAPTRVNLANPIAIFVIIAWMSVLLSAFIDNAPYTIVAM
jgi:hypothetical protein